MYTPLKGVCKEDGARFFLIVPSDAEAMSTGFSTTNMDTHCPERWWSLPSEVLKFYLDRILSSWL